MRGFEITTHRLDTITTRQEYLVDCHIVIFMCIFAHPTILLLNPTIASDNDNRTSMAKSDPRRVYTGWRR